MLSFLLLDCFFCPLWPDDERDQFLRFRALAAGFFVSFVVLFVGSFTVPALNGVEKQMRQGLQPQLFGVWDATIITLAAALAVFWFWRYRDGAEAKPATGWRRVVQMCLTGR